MIAHLRDGVKPRLATLHTVYLGWAYGDTTSTTPAVPYYVLSGPSWGTPDEAPVCGVDEALDAEFRLTGVAGTAEGAGIILKAAMELLSPNGAETPLVVPGRTATVQWVRSEFIGVDRDLTVPQTNRHPGVGVDTYRLVSEPL